MIAIIAGLLALLTLAATQSHTLYAKHHSGIFNPPGQSDVYTPEVHP